MNPNMPQEVVQEKPARVIPIKIGDVLCYPKFKCIHLTNPGQEQLKKDLHRYRFKELLIQLFENAQDYGASDEWLHFKLFAEKSDSLRLIWEYTNMMIFDCGGDNYLNQMPSDSEIFKRLSDFYKANSTLPLSEEKNIIGLFRKMMQMDNYFEELARTKQQIANIEKGIEVMEERKEDMEVEGLEDLPKLFISPIEKLMDEFKGSVKEFRGLFKIPRENIALVSLNTLHQQICLTARDCFESTQGECNLFGLEFTKDEQISNWLSRVDNYKQIQLPSTAEGFMNVLTISKEHSIS